MQFADDSRYALYGLRSGNPYVSRPLDAVTCESDHELLLELAGFIPLTTLKTAIEQKAGRKRPVFVLITGVGKSGRTSLANHIMRLYRDAATSPGATFVTHRAEPDDMTHDAYAQICSTLLSLRNKMNECAIKIPDELRARFTELGQRTRADRMNEYDLQDIAGLAGSTFAAAKVAFGIRYEGVPTKQLITLATKVFESTSTVVVFTVDAYEHANTVRLTKAERERFAARGHIVDLGTLTPEQISELAKHRWNGRPPAPFHEQGLTNALSGREYTVGQALRRLEVLLDFRLSEYEKDDPWPTDDLHMHENWLRLKIWQGERWNGMGDIHG
ncbi:hypothetical protein [Nonomuraea zeae]|uniref:Uncharacterized protein n=1 Tax=Nonomuraea zeae TaxID=1642303 RepID=A0A5S4HDT5_9ACTN|nr:hypothetical protein [Nonomuraea zeae]TMR37060.1 hypothetical protein ETD85_08985 [Nonomuraea zeae]